MPLERPLDESGPGQRLLRFVCAALRLASPHDVPAKLAMSGAAWEGLLAFLDRGVAPPADVALTLATLYAALRAVGAGDRYLAEMASVRFPLACSGTAWRRELGPVSPLEAAFERALETLRLERWGLHWQRRVSIAGESVAWAIAGLLPDGQVVRLALAVRPAPDHLGALREDLADDAVAAAGFSILGFRDWQLRYPGACALHVGHVIAQGAPHCRLPGKLLDPDDDHPVHRLQASPARLTPREASPQWALREALRQAHPEADRPALEGLLLGTALDRSAASAEGGEWPVWG